jgi:DNA-binding NtrC family response regulator
MPTLSLVPSSANAHLLVIENDSSRKVALPHAGAIVIGRAAEADIRVDHASVSRLHARFIVEGATLVVADLGSHNKTRVNGELVDQPRALASGDVVMIGDVVVIVHGVAAATAERTAIHDTEWRRRLDEEVARVLVYKRSFAITVIARIPEARRSVVADTVSSAVRVIDVVGAGSHDQIYVLEPEVSGEAARDRAAALLARVAAVAPDAAAGVSCCPADGCDGDTLMLTARAAARSAAGRQVVAASDAVTRLELGDRRVVLAHPAMLRVFDLLKRLAAHDLPVLVTGETGAGKENAAYAVHWWSSRRDRPFVTLNCAAIPQTLVESELFGHDKGAFSGAVAARAGVFESADGGTVFLDEVGELPLAIQAKLLRVLEAKTVTRVGEVKERRIDVRVVAATNRSLADEAKHGRFRDDLFFRLSAATVILPPLRERRAEIPLLARDLLAQACARAGRPAMQITPAAMQQLVTYAWPGNVRELRNVMDYLTAAAVDDRVEPDDLPPPFAAEATPAPPPDEPSPSASGSLPRLTGFAKLSDEIEALERLRMREALDAATGVKTKAAALIGMSIRTFAMKVKQYGLDRAK